MRLGVQAFELVAGVSRTATREVAEDLARAGALLRSADGEPVVDPSLRAVVAMWAGAAVRVDVRVRDGHDEHVAEGALAPGLAVCVIRGRRAGALMDAVEVRVPGAGGLVGAVLDGSLGSSPGWASPGADRVAAPASLPDPRRTLWARVRCPGWTGLDHCRDDGEGWHRVTPAGDGRVRLHPVGRGDVERTLLSGLTLALAGAAA